MNPVAESAMDEMEPNPSFAGTKSRCEFFIKPLRTMVELKYARRGDDLKLTTGLTLDFAQYGANPDVDKVVVLIYDPAYHLKDPVQLQEDLSGPRHNLEQIQVVVSPPR